MVFSLITDWLRQRLAGQTCQLNHSEVVTASLPDAPQAGRLSLGMAAKMAQLGARARKRSARKALLSSLR